MKPSRNKASRPARSTAQRPPPPPQMHRSATPTIERPRRAPAATAIPAASGTEAMGGGLFAALAGRESNGSGGTWTGSDEEGLGLLKQQLSAVQRIRVEHERKESVIAGLRLEVADLHRDKEEALHLKHECNGLRLRMAGMEERCRHLEDAERDSAHRWARKEDVWRTQLRDADERLRASQEQCLAERDRAEELAALKEELEAALASALSDAKAAAAISEREQSGRTEAEFRAGTISENLNIELEAERAKATGLEEKMRMLEKDLAASKDESDRLSPLINTLEEANGALRTRCSEAELELAQLNVYRPLVERADAIDRQRIRAEDGLRAAEAELGRERASLEAVKRDAAELQAALERRAAKLVEAEAEASKTLSLERELLSAASRLKAAEADKDNAARALLESEDARWAVAGALDELAELSSEALSPLAAAMHTSSAPEGAGVEGRGVAEGVSSSPGQGVGGGRVDGSDGGGCGGDALAKLAELEAGLRRKSMERGRDTVGGAKIAGAGLSEAWEGGRMYSWGKGGGELRRAVRAVRALAEAGARVAADRDRAAKELALARGNAMALRDCVEASQREGKRATRALEDASAARSALLPRLRDAQVSKQAAEAGADKAISELADIRDFLGSLAGTFALRTTDAFPAGDTSPWSDSQTSARQPSPAQRAEAGGSGSKSRASLPSSARLISTVSAGVKGLLAGRAAAADSIRELESRCAHNTRELEELHHRIRDRDVAHREQLTELRTWCESEVETQRRGKKVAQTAAERALRDLSAALKKMSAFEKKKTRISNQVAVINERLSALDAEASAAKAGLRLVARACAPLLDRCRTLAAQKRLLSKWQRSTTAGNSTAFVSLSGANGAGGGTGATAPDTGLLVAGLRALVGALNRGAQEEPGGKRGGAVRYAEQSSAPRPLWIAADGEDRHGEGGGVGVFGAASRPRRPLVSLRAVAIASVAARRLVRLAALRAARRGVAEAAATGLAAHPCRGMGADRSAGSSPSSRRSPSRQGEAGHLPTARAGLDEREGVIPLGPRGFGGVPMLCEAEVPSVPATALTDGGRGGACLLSPGSTRTSHGPSDEDAGAGRDSAADRCIRLLGILVVTDGGAGGGGGGGCCGGGGALVGVDEPTLLQVLAAGQAGHWRRLEKRGLVPPQSGGKGGGASRVVAGRFVRHHGSSAWKARVQCATEEEAVRLLEATRRGTAALARCAGEAESRLVESETRRLHAGTELEASVEMTKALRAELDQKSESMSYLEERLRIVEGEAAGTVPVTALAATEKALSESMAEVETLRVRMASLEAEASESAAKRKKAARRARRGARTACQEQAVRAQLQDELLSLRSYVLRSEQTVQELQEEARRQAREAGRRTGDGGALTVAAAGIDRSWD